METNAGTFEKVLNRLKAAIGYHELGMTQQALRCLDSLLPLGKIGPFGLVQEVLRGEFTRSQVEDVPVARALENAAVMLPAAARHAVEMTLAACYGKSEALGRAAKIAASARGGKLAGEHNPAG